MDIKDLIDDALFIADKREALCRDPRLCPRCESEQIQLVDWLNDAEWKCRHCSHKWETK